MRFLGNENIGTFNGDVFIIPNGLSVYEDLRIMQEFYKDLCELNGVDPTGEQFVQVWICSDELNTENMSCHGFRVNGNYMNAFCGDLPVSLVKDLREGDTVTVNFRAYPDINMGSSDEIITMNLKLNQSDYRYRRFGNFEEVLRRLL